MTTPAHEPWPPLPLDEWKETYATLHMWFQVIGKIRLAQTPLIRAGHPKRREATTLSRELRQAIGGASCANATLRPFGRR